MSIMISPLRAPSRIPFEPATTSSTCAELGTMVITTSDAIATARDDGASLAPALSTSCTSGFSGWRAYMVTSCPAFSRLSVIGRPMTPIPIKPICIIVVFLNFYRFVIICLFLWYFLLHFSQHNSSFYYRTFLIKDMAYFACVRSCDGMFHFHGVEDHQYL